MTKKQLKQLKRMRRWTATTHWVQGAWQTFKLHKSGKWASPRDFSPKSVKECWCLEGMILKVCGMNPCGGYIDGGAYDLKRETPYRAGHFGQSEFGEHERLARIVWRGIKKLCPHARRMGAIAGWNDSQRRTKEDVLKVLDYLIAEGEAEHS